MAPLTLTAGVLSRPPLRGGLASVYPRFVYSVAAARDMQFQPRLYISMFSVLGLLHFPCNLASYPVRGGEKKAWYMVHIARMRQHIHSNQSRLHSNRSRGTACVHVYIRVYGQYTIISDSPRFIWGDPAHAHAMCTRHPGLVPSAQRLVRIILIVGSCARPAWPINNHSDRKKPDLNCKPVSNHLLDLKVVSSSFSQLNYTREDSWVIVRWLVRLDLFSTEVFACASTCGVSVGMQQ